MDIVKHLSGLSDIVGNVDGLNFDHSFCSEKLSPQQSNERNFIPCSVREGLGLQMFPKNPGIAEIGLPRKRTNKAIAVHFCRQKIIEN